MQVVNDILLQQKHSAELMRRQLLSFYRFGILYRVFSDVSCKREPLHIMHMDFAQ